MSPDAGFARVFPDGRLVFEGRVLRCTLGKAGVKPAVFLLANLGYPPYSQALIVTRNTLEKRRDVLARFLRASAEGWKSYLANPAPGNALIRKDNPQMSDELLAYGWRKMKDFALVDAGEAMKSGLLTMTETRPDPLRAAALRHALATRVVVADGAMVH
jgi:NitT/TauT family transport system substrate-binding protein